MNECNSCQLTESGKPVLILENGWLVNHYDGKEGYLGWLALSPVRHVMSLGELSENESKSLGVSINRLDRALRAYWPITFSEALARVYVSYFFEGAALGDMEPWHLHFHIIPRPISFDSEWLAWNIASASMCSKFPDTYSKNSNKFDSRYRALMEYLRTAIVPLT